MDEKLIQELERTARNLLAASVRVMADLNHRIDRASKAGGTVPVFDGIGSLNMAIAESERTFRAIGASRAEKSQPEGTHEVSSVQS